MKKSRGGGGIPGIPPAPTARWNLKKVDIYMQKKYQKVYERLPVLGKEEILRLKYPYHSLLFRTLTEEGYSEVVKEINAMVQLEQLQERGRNLLLEKDKLTLIASTLKECEQLKAMDKRDLGLELKKTLAEKLIMEYHDIWLAIKFIESCLESCALQNDPDPHRLYTRVSAEAHAVMGCIAHGFPGYFENATDVIISNLDVCRELSDLHRVWQFKRDFASFKIARPATLQGLRKDYDTISSSALSVYVFATTLLQEVYFNIADNILDEDSLSESRAKIACEWAEKAAMLAIEVRHPVSLYTSILRYGQLLFKVGKPRAAFPYFEDLHDRALVNLDTVTQAVAMNNMGLCYDRERETIKAMEQFNEQLKLSEENNLKDTAGAAYYEMGKILLCEGQLWEAEECYQKSHAYLHASEELDPDSDLRDITWAMIGITAGQNMWSRYAGLCQSRDFASFGRVRQWKCRRHPLPLVGRPDYLPDLISDFYSIDLFYNPETAAKGKSDEKKVTFHKGESQRTLSVYRDMLYQDDSFVGFASDVRSDQLVDYRNFCINRSLHWARSLTVALQKRSSQINANVTRNTARSGRQLFVEKQTARDIQFFDYD